MSVMGEASDAESRPVKELTIDAARKCRRFIMAIDPVYPSERHLKEMAFGRTAMPGFRRRTSCQSVFVFSSRERDLLFVIAVPIPEKVYFSFRSLRREERPEMFIQRTCALISYINEKPRRASGAFRLFDIFCLQPSIIHASNSILFGGRLGGRHAI